MKIKGLLSIVILLLMSCGNNINSEEFIINATGRYLYNSDEIIEVYFNEKDLFLKWRGAESIKPLKVNGNTFFVKEMNEKIQFLTNPTDTIFYIVLVPKTDDKSIQYNFRKLQDNEHIPSFYLKNKEFEKAKEGYLTIKRKDSLDPTIKEVDFNRKGYRLLRDKKIDEAIAMFQINAALYPYSSNVYDSLGEALLKKGDTINGISNYKKALELDSGNKRARKVLEKHSKNN